MVSIYSAFSIFVALASHYQAMGGSPYLLNGTDGRTVVLNYGRSRTLDHQEKHKVIKLVRALARRYRMNPHLILSVIKVESNFRPYVISNRGAIGLMQLKPDTAAWIAPKCGIQWEGEAMLYKPEKNIRLGVCYLSYLRRKFRGDLEKMLSAYNQGPAKVYSDLADGGALSLRYYRKVSNQMDEMVMSRNGSTF